ncbi:hypothetical protein BpHYR1_020796 [Brachionus plicatilis]|uniref:RNA-directed DNA polymerase from mobile element jockey-like n=1 Tax=Brachionus plicatilis TaxID=10195 RepID=A0A3M7S9Q4_BRAPC|nr:hypothetical protein BpHYR1_020796 [Brachionus plicatilis]
MRTFSVYERAILQKDQNAVCQWIEVWRMGLCADKCKVMHFGRLSARHKYADKSNSNRSNKFSNREEFKVSQIIKAISRPGRPKFLYYPKNICVRLKNLSEK